jgi:hypothetical protein
MKIDPSSQLAPVTGIVVAVVIAGGDPNRTAAGRIRIVTADINPAAIDPFIVASDPDRTGIRGGPAMIGVWRRRGWCTDLNANAYLRGGRRRAER